MRQYPVKRAPKDWCTTSGHMSFGAATAPHGHSMYSVMQMRQLGMPDLKF